MKHNYSHISKGIPDIYSICVNNENERVYISKHEAP